MNKPEPGHCGPSRSRGTGQPPGTADPVTAGQGLGDRSPTHDPVVLGSSGPLPDARGAIGANELPQLAGKDGAADGAADEVVVSLW